MKKEKILIYVDKQKSAVLDNNIEAVQSGSSDLITIFEKFQNYKKVKTQSDFITLVEDPLKIFDDVLQGNVNFQESGGKKGSPSVIANLFDIDRDSYIKLIRGEKIIEGSCKSCAGLKIKKTGSPVLSNSNYKQYEKYLIWNGHGFDINEDQVSETKETFNYYIEGETQIECYNFWHNACSTLNTLAKKGYLGDIDSFAKLTKGRITHSYQSNQLDVDEVSLLQELKSLEFHSLKN